jgi:hypothetical protein
MFPKLSAEEGPSAVTTPPATTTGFFS